MRTGPLVAARTRFLGVEVGLPACAAGQGFDRVDRGLDLDLGDQSVRARLQRYFDESGRFPPARDPTEYSTYFELAFPSANDRRRYIERLADQAVPSFGHEVLAYYLKHGRIAVVWTTNFEPQAPSEARPDSRRECDVGHVCTHTSAAISFAIDVTRSDEQVEAVPR